MTLERIALGALEPHPENSNRMSPALLKKLMAHIRRTGRYEPLIVRPIGEPGSGQHQILNGHHRAQVLKALKHTHARCDVWPVGEDEARLLLATLNRLEGRDDPSARAALVARLSARFSTADLARLLPEPPDALERLRRLAEPPPQPRAPQEAAPLARPMTFFLAEEPYALVAEALREAGRAAGEAPRCSRAEALERLALWYLEARGLR